MTPVMVAGAAWATVAGLALVAWGRVGRDRCRRGFHDWAPSAMGDVRCLRCGDRS